MTNFATAWFETTEEIIDEVYLDGIAQANVDFEKTVALAVIVMG